MANLDIRCLIPAEVTKGRMALFEEMVPPGAGPPVHRHLDSMKVYHILQGRFLFEIDGQPYQGDPGSIMVIPDGVPHAFKNMANMPGCLRYELLPPGEAEHFFNILGTQLDAIEDWPRFFAEHRMEFVGPPL